MGSANTDYSVFNAMAAQMTNDKMDSKFEEIVRVMLEQNNLPDKTINDLKILAKKGVSTKTTTELKKSDLPRDLNCGKYTPGLPLILNKIFTVTLYKVVKIEIFMRLLVINVILT